MFQEYQKPNVYSFNNRKLTGDLHVLKFQFIYKK